MIGHDIFGSLVVYLYTENELKLDKGTAYLETVESGEKTLVDLFGHTVLINLTFKGDAILHIKFDGCAHKQILIKRFHSSPFPKKGGFCVSSEIKPKDDKFALIPEKINIYSSDFLEHTRVDKLGNPATNSIHNLNKQPA